MMANSRLPRLPKEAYAIGIICALSKERAAVEAMLDEIHEARPQDYSNYTFGKIGNHNVVVSCSLIDQKGQESVSLLASDVIGTIYDLSIKLGLIVGVGGGVPSHNCDIRLGDVVVSLPSSTRRGVIQYEPDNIDSGGLHSSKGHPDKSPNALLSALASLRAKHEADEPDFHDYLSVMFEGRRIAKNYVLHGSEKAQLSGHNNQRVIRAPREDESPQVFYGIIGSGDLVMNNGAVSSLEAADDNTICFEMEERGVMSDFPYLVIRGISDYADSYENDQWQPYAAMTAAAYAKELLGAVSVQEVERLDPARKHLVSFSLWKMPATDRFIQRDEDMRKLEDFFLSQASRSDRRKVFAIHGVSGIGKTQLCNEFARKHRARYTAVLWMDGTSEVALQQSFVEVFSRLPVEEMPPNLVEAVKRHEASADRIVKGVLDWLSLPSNQRWLHIIDNVDHDINAKGKDPLAYDLEKYSAQVDHGSLLIISRVSTLTVPQDAHQLTEMNPDEARALFENHRGKPVSVQPARDESKDLESLLRKLDGMPLALAQAGSYIRETNTSLRKYLVYYDNTLEELVADQDSYPSHDPTQRSMLATWMISYQQIESQSWEGATLLKLWAFLDPKDIWDELLTCAIEPGSETDLPEWLSTLAKNSSKLYDVRRLLREYCFVNKERDYSMHAVLHPWCRHLASISSTSERFPELAVSLVTHSLSSKRYKDRELIWMRLYPHGQQLLHQLRLGMIWKSSCIPPGAYDQLVKLFEYNRASEEVTAVLESVLEEREKISGTDHPKTADTAYNLARVYLALKRHAESQKLAERALAVYERSLGSHPGHSTAENVRSMICTLECLGLNYEHQMRPEDAEDMYKRAIAISEQQQHTKHNNALGVMALLGDVYTRRARFAEAVLVFERALEVSKEIYGPFHHLALQFAIKLGKVMRLRDQKIAENTKILQQLLRAAKIPSGKHCVSLHQWEYPSTIETWRASSPAPAFEGDTKQESRSTNLTAKMLETVTISGYSPCFEAMTCEQYVRKRWGSIGIQVATFLTEAAQLVQNNTFDDLGTQVQIQKIELVIKQDDLDDSTSEVVAFAAPDYVCLFVQNLDDSKIQKIQETAQWICQTFRSLPLKSNDLGALQMSRFSQPADLYPQAGLKVKAFGLLPLEPLEIHQANCWTALFEAGVVAETTCSEGPELEGIEMSFDLMTALAAVETYHSLQHSDTTGGLILLGFFTALVPVSFHQSGVIQWHFEYSETDILRPMDLESTQKPWEFVNAPSRLSGGRCIVGIWPQANIMLGVQGTRLDLEDSGLPHRSSVTLPKGVEVTAGLSPSAGPVQVVAQITRSYEQVTTRQRFSRANAYVTALNRLSQAVSLIYDCKTHTGWLVPQMSLLLHLCHAYWARSITSKRNSNPTDPIPWAKPSTDGASAAFDAFTGSGDIVVSKVGDKTDDQLLLRQLLVDLNSNLQATYNTRQPPKKFLRWTTEIYFSELQDQISEPGEGSALRALKLSEWPSIEAWLDITHKVDGLLVCKNLDQAIVLVGPSSSTSATTTQATSTHLLAHPASCSCGKVPEGQGYLVAHAWCLQNILKRPSPAASKDKVTWIHNGKPLDVDSIKPNECIWTHPERVLQSFGKPAPGYTCNSSSVNAVEGAVVFGKYDEGTLVEWFKKLKLQP